VDLGGFFLLGVVYALWKSAPMVSTVTAIWLRSSAARRAAWRVAVSRVRACDWLQVNIQVHFAVAHSSECQVYRCRRCSTVFHSEMEWHLHVRVHHLGVARPFRCLFCRCEGSVDRCSVSSATIINTHTHRHTHTPV